MSSNVSYIGILFRLHTMSTLPLQQYPSGQQTTIFLDVAYNPNSNSDILAEATLTELIDNNRIVLENKIKK